MYLNWGYAAANGAIIAFPLLIFSRTLSPRQLVAGGGGAVAERAAESFWGKCNGGKRVGRQLGVHPHPAGPPPPHPAPQPTN